MAGLLGSVVVARRSREAQAIVAMTRPPPFGVRGVDQDSPSAYVRAGVAPGLIEYLSYYGLRAQPFQTGSSRTDPWLARSHRQALAVLTSAVQQGDGLQLLTGDAGTGKTCLLTSLIDAVRGESLIIGALHSVFEVAELPQAIADAFAIGGQFPDPASFATRFRQFLGEAHGTGKKVL